MPFGRPVIAIVGAGVAGTALAAYLAGERRAASHTLHLLSGHDDGLTGLLLADGLVRLDRSGRGYEVDEQGQVVAASGTSVPNFFALGPLRGGYAIESNVLPDFRPQLQDLTDRLLERLAP